MQQHPLPQNVTSYQFRLIGDMTIKQFIFLSVGVGGAIFFYYTNLFSPIKWAFVISSGLFGFATAFMPYEDRPLDQWITNYLKAIYRPTRFVWRKNLDLPAYFTHKASSNVLPADAEELARTAALRKQQGLRSFLVTLPKDQIDPLAAQESSSAAAALSLFNQTSAPPVDLSAPIATSLNITPQAAPTPLSSPTPASAAAPPPAAASAPISTGVVNLAPIQINKIESALTESISGSVPVSQVQPNSSTIAMTDVAAPAVAATTASDLPFPSTPTTPNTIVGMVLDPTGRIVDNAIIEVADDMGLTARATKTNQLGQFFSTTPLKNGTYRLQIEKTGLTFDTIELALVGSIIEPLKIQAKS